MKKLIEGAGRGDRPTSRPTRPRRRQLVSRRHRRRSPARPIAADLVIASFKNIDVHPRPDRVVAAEGRRATPKALGLLDSADLKGIYDLTLLNEAAEGSQASRPIAAVNRRCDRRRSQLVALGVDSTPHRVEATPRPRVVAIDRRLQGRSAHGGDARRTRSTASPSTSRRGEFVCLLGASGCGKSTLLNLVAGLDQPDVGHGRRRGRRAPALMFQEAALFPWLTVRGNVELALKLARRAASRAARAGRRAARAGAPRRLRRQAARTSCRAACASGSRSPGRSPRTPTCC